MTDQSDYDAALADIEAAYPGINDDGSCTHGMPYDQCQVCSPPLVFLTPSQQRTMHRALRRSLRIIAP